MAANPAQGLVAWTVSFLTQHGGLGLGLVEDSYHLLMSIYIITFILNLVTGLNKQIA